MLLLYDFFPTARHRLSHVPLILGASHPMFPGIPIYDAGVFPRSPPLPVELNTSALDTRTYAGYVIPTTSPLHHAHLRSEQEFTAQVIRSPARQFSLIQTIGPDAEDSILVRQGSYLVLFEEVWRLALVILEQDKVQLFYQPEMQPVPMLLRIVEEHQAEPGFSGKYELVDMTSR